MLADQPQNNPRIVAGKPTSLASATGSSHTFAEAPPLSRWTCGGSLGSRLQKYTRKPWIRRIVGTNGPHRRIAQDATSLADDTPTGLAGTHVPASRKCLPRAHDYPPPNPAVAVSPCMNRRIRRFAPIQTDPRPVLPTLGALSPGLEARWSRHAAQATRPTAQRDPANLLTVLSGTLSPCQQGTALGDVQK